MKQKNSLFRVGKAREKHEIPGDFRCVAR